MLILIKDAILVSSVVGASLNAWRVDKALMRNWDAAYVFRYYENIWVRA